MKVASVSSLNIYYKINNTLKQKSNALPSDCNNYELPNYQITFIGQNSKANELTISGGKYMLLKELDEIFKEEKQDVKPSEAVIDSYNKLRKMRYEDEKIERLFSQANLLFHNKHLLNPQMGLEEANRIRKEARRLEKVKKKPTFVPAQTKKKESGLDFKLLHTFETAIQDDKFNLRKVFIEYHKGLSDIKTIEELKTRYPKIKIPKTPIDVVSDKYLNVLTRDFYLTLDKMYEENSPEEINAFIEQKVKQITSQIKQTNKNLKKNEDKLAVPIKKVEKSAIKKIQISYKKYSQNNSISVIPEQRKIKIPKITDSDISLMLINFNDFILNVLRQQYLELKKPNDIVVNGVKVSSLKDSEYKFERIDEKVRNIMAKSDKLHQAQRNYDAYTVDNLKTRLVFYADRIDSDEDLLGKIIDFSGCKFEPDDIKMLKLFLKELDLIYDGEKNIDQALESIEKQKIRPAGTERLNEIERKKAIEAIKLEQKKLAKLTNKQNLFDDAINLLYDNNLTETAEICSKYRPKSLSKDEIETGDFIVGLIDSGRSKANRDIIDNPSRLETSIVRWNTYYEYKHNSLDDEILQEAERYAQKDNGEIDIDKAGKYIMNYEFIEIYPESLELSQNQELVRKIMDNFDEEHKFDAIKYLCKLDDYNDLSDDVKTYISTIMKKFNMKDNIEKIIIKHIVENNYIMVDTNNYLNIKYSGDKKVQTTITSKAKQEIYDYYQFPKCLLYFRLFEEAQTKLAKTIATAGIKPLGGNNNSMSDVYELKIKGHDDRLLSYDGTYRFDTFDPTGLH